MLTLLHSTRPSPVRSQRPGDGRNRVCRRRVASLALGGVAALVAGVVAIWFFLRLLRTQGFYRFAYYTWGAGALFLAWLVLRAS